eukprot:1158988-Pelagomonas_calceolata.AAC.18
MSAGKRLMALCLMGLLGSNGSTCKGGVASNDDAHCTQGAKEQKYKRNKDECKRQKQSTKNMSTGRQDETPLIIAFVLHADDLLYWCIHPFELMICFISAPLFCGNNVPHYCIYAMC